jgi:hypothetical protein
MFQLCITAVESMLLSQQNADFCTSAASFINVLNFCRQYFITPTHVLYQCKELFFTARHFMELTVWAQHRYQFFKRSQYVKQLLLHPCCYIGLPPIPVAAGSKAWAYSFELAGTAVSNPTGATDCVVSEGDHEASIMRRPWPTKGCTSKERPRFTVGCSAYSLTTYNLHPTSKILTGHRD